MKKYGLLLLLTSAFTNTSAAEISKLGFINADFGGDTLVNVTYADGSSADIDAGRGISFGGGANWHLSDDFVLQTTAAWKFTTIPQATNGDLTWTRIPVEAIAFYNTEKFRIGAGISYHLANKLEGTGVASSLSADFDSTIGTVVSYEHLTSNRISYVVRYTMIDYTPSAGSASANGNSIGFGMNMYFGK